MTSTIRVRTILSACVLLLWPLAPAAGQALDIGQIRASTDAALADMDQRRAAIQERFDAAVGPLSSQRCACDRNDIAGGCSVRVSMLPDGPTSRVLRIVVEDRLKRGQCARVSTYITTEQDLLNRTPTAQQMTVLRQNVEEEPVPFASWNGREPILAPDARPECELCAAPGEILCRDGPGISGEAAARASYSGNLAAELAPAMDHMRQNAKVLREAGQIVPIWQELLDRARSDAAHFTEMRERLERHAAEWCG